MGKEGITVHRIAWTNDAHQIYIDVHHTVVMPCARDLDDGMVMIVSTHPSSPLSSVSVQGVIVGGG